MDEKILADLQRVMERLEKMEASIMELKELTGSVDKRMSALENDVQEIREGNDLRNFAQAFKGGNASASTATMPPGQYRRSMYAGIKEKGHSLSYYNQD